MSSFWRHSRGIFILKRLYYKAHYTIQISDIFMILHLNDTLLQRSMGMLYLITYLFIIIKVQCKEKKIWTTSVVIQLGFMPRYRNVREEIQRQELFFSVSFCFHLLVCSSFWGCDGEYAQETALCARMIWHTCRISLA